MKRAYCLSEDREDTGLRLAIVTLHKFCPGETVILYRPTSSPEFLEWLKSYSAVKLIPFLPEGAKSWNCKPHVMIPLLEQGYEEVIWLDSDILLTRNPNFLFDSSPPELLIGTEEPPSQPYQGSKIRTAWWNLPLGRSYYNTLNSCVVRTTRHHLPLLYRWRELLHDPRYVYLQEQPLRARPLYMMSDQDVLNAIIGSKEFESVPVHLLRAGRDVIHTGRILGHSLSAALASLAHRIPPFLHGTGAKPWYVFDSSFRTNHTAGHTFLRRLLQEISPYLRESRKYRIQVGVDCPWMSKHSLLGVLLRGIGLGHFALPCLPLIAAATLIRSIKKPSYSSF